MSKGSKPRPIDKDKIEQFRENWDNIFNKNKKQKNKKVDKLTKIEYNPFSFLKY